MGGGHLQEVTPQGCQFLGAYYSTKISGKFWYETEWNGSVQLENSQKRRSAFWGGPPFWLDRSDRKILFYLTNSGFQSLSVINFWKFSSKTKWKVTHSCICRKIWWHLSRYGKNGKEKKWWEPVKDDHWIWSIERKTGITVHLRELNLCVNITMPTSAIVISISSSVYELDAWRGVTLQRELCVQ